MTLALLPRDQKRPFGDVDPSLANQACSACRKQKRKCDKILPTCGLCSRMGRTCDYADSSPAPTAEDMAILQSRIAELESRLSSQETPSSSVSNPNPTSFGPEKPLWVAASSTLPPLFFLHIDRFKYAGLAVPKPSGGTPQVSWISHVFSNAVARSC